MSNERFAELLPWYVNGSLDAADRAWVDDYLAKHPEARSELTWFRSLQSRIREAAPAVPATIGLARAMHRIQGDRPTIAERLGSVLSMFSVRPALALGMLAVIVVQGGVIASMMLQAHDQAAEEMRALNAKTVEEGPLVKINFAPDARESDIRMLLVSIQGTLAGGPGQLGDYYVRVPPGKEAEAAAKLKERSIVQAVELAPGLPAHD